MVRIVAAGTATSTTAPAIGDMFVGVAMETVIYDATIATQYVRVYTSGVFPFTKDTPAASDVGCLAYVDQATNQQTVVVAQSTTGDGGGIIVGAVVGLCSTENPSNTTEVFVKICPGLTVGLANA
jgi:predicted RecA/RadA family phage recombinase